MFWESLSFGSEKIIQTRAVCLKSAIVGLCENTNHNLYENIKLKNIYTKKLYIILPGLSIQQKVYFVWFKIWSTLIKSTKFPTK